MPINSRVVTAAKASGRAEREGERQSHLPPSFRIQLSRRARKSRRFCIHSGKRKKMSGSCGRKGATGAMKARPDERSEQRWHKSAKHGQRQPVQPQKGAGQNDGDAQYGQADGEAVIGDDEIAQPCQRHDDDDDGADDGADTAACPRMSPPTIPMTEPICEGMRVLASLMR